MAKNKKANFGWNEAIQQLSSEMKKSTKELQLQKAVPSAPVAESRLLPAVLWSYIGVDDFIFRHGDYCLRVEKMDKGYYWWCVYYKDEYAGFDEPRAKTEKEAKLLAELCFIRHIVEHGR